MSSAKWQPFCLGLIVLNQYDNIQTLIVITLKQAITLVSDIQTLPGVKNYNVAENLKVTRQNVRGM